MLRLASLLPLLPLLAAAPLPMPLLGLGDNGGLLSSLGPNSGGASLPVLGSTGQTTGTVLGVAAGVTADVGSVLSVALGVTLDLDATTQLLCSLVSGTFSDKAYDLGCTCLGSDGGILLDVDVDVEAVVNVVGLEAWVQAQVSDPARKKEYVVAKCLRRLIWEGLKLGTRRVRSRLVMVKEGTTARLAMVQGISPVPSDRRRRRME